MTPHLTCKDENENQIQGTVTQSREPKPRDLATRRNAITLIAITSDSQ